MKPLLIACSCVSYATLAWGIEGQRDVSRGVDRIVDAFSVTGQRTPAVIELLAKKAHVVIGVSGEMFGSDRKTISINTRNASLKALLDDICAKDPRYKWQETTDGNINMSTRDAKRLTLLDVVITNIKIGSIKSHDVTSVILDRPEIRKWQSHNDCNIGEVIAGTVTNEYWTLNIDAANEKLWKILNDISTQNGTYFWSAVKFSNEPCTINLAP